MEKQFFLKLCFILGLAGFFLLSSSFYCENSGIFFSGIAFCQPDDEEEEEPIQTRPAPDVKPSPMQHKGRWAQPSAMDDGEHGDGKVQMQSPSTPAQTMQPSAPAQTMRPKAPEQAGRALP